MPNLSLLLTAEPLVQLHVLGATLSILLLPFVLLRRRRDRMHRIGGYIWVCAMATTALSSFGITGNGTFGPFSPIHGLSVLTLIGLFHGLRLAIRRNRVGHQKAMQNLAFWALGVAGALSFMPDRLMNRVFFPDAPDNGFFYVVVLGAAAGVMAQYFTQRATGR